MFLRYLLFIVIISLLSSSTCRKTKSSGNNPPPVPGNTMIHRSGKNLVNGNNQIIQLKGIAFGNEVWSNTEIPSTHHTEEDFARVKTMNMNAVRFYMNYKTFENDLTPYQYKQSGWNWIDLNIAWAKKHGIYLILNMHVPQGGFQSQGTGDALWNSTENQNRLAALWKAIAAKYKNETQIAGFGLVNEPVPTSSLNQWTQLSQRIATEIRTVDQQHLLFVEKPIYVKGVNTENADYNFPMINDDNTVYEFHVYDPLQYTHQLFTWAGMGDGGKYPDDNVISYTNGSWYTATFDNPAINAGTHDWAYFEGVKFKITDPKIKLGVPALVATNVTGKVYFDDMVIKEYDASGNFVQDIAVMSLDDLDGWTYWSKNNSGSSSVANTGHSNGKSLSIENATDDCNMSNYNRLFYAKQGFSYQVSGWMKGENIAVGAGCRLRIDFITTENPIYGRNKQYLETILKKYTDWAAVKNVPVYMGEFGAGVHCFQNNKGGLLWVNDMLDIAKSTNLHFTYHVYHEDNFGLYFGYGTLPNPANANQPLIDLLTDKLK